MVDKKYKVLPGGNAMSAIAIVTLNNDSVFLCEKYLVAIFDKDKNYYLPSIWLTSHMSWVYGKLCRRA